jgi:hypothetical protein
MQDVQDRLKCDFRLFANRYHRSYEANPKLRVQTPNTSPKNEYQTQKKIDAVARRVSGPIAIPEISP